MKKLVLLRGLPGAGKSTAAKVLFPDACHAEADQYFEKEDGTYAFDKEQLYAAHKECQSKIETWMIQEKPLIVVSNTNTRQREIRPYYEMANMFNYTVFSLIVENRHGNENIHDVPEKTLLKMKNRFEVVL